MLEKVRKNVKSFGVQFVIIVVVAAFIGTIFLVWGHGGKSERQGTVLAKIYEKDITYPEYQQEYMQLVQQYRQMYKERWSNELAEQLDLRRLALDNILNQYVLLHKALEWGVNVSEEEVTDHIKSLEIFQINGEFSPDLFHQRLDMAQVTTQKFRNDILRHLLFTKIQERIAGGVKISDEEISEEFAEKHEKIKADYILVPLERFMSEVQISLDELKEYYEAHKDQYLYPERRTVEYLFLNPRDFESDANVTEQEMELYYSHYENMFITPKQVKASHILLKVDQGASPEEDAKVKERAVELLDKIKSGEDFQELAKAHSDCPSSKRGGDLGYFGKGKMDPEFEKAAFALDAGEVSQVIRSSFGYHIIKVEDIKPEHVKPLDEVRDEIVRLIKRDKGRELALLKAEDLIREIFRGKFVRELAFEDRVSYKEAGPFFNGEILPGIGKSKEIMDEVFGMEIGKVSRIIETPKGYYILKLLAIDPPRQSAYEEVEAKVEQDAKKEKAGQKAHDNAEKIRERLLTGADMANLASEYKLNVSSTGEFGRGGYISGLGSLDDQDTGMLFLLKGNDISHVIESSRGFVVFKITEKIDLDESEFARQKDTIRDRLLQVKQQELFTAWIERVKKKANIEILNEELIS